MLKKLLSYITPIPVKKIRSPYNKQLEIHWVDGQLVLDTVNTTYSYGKLEQVFKKSLKFVGYHKIKPMNNILNLGLGAGSTVHLLRNEINCKGKITSIEIDETILFIAEKFFNIKALNENHTILKADAFEYVLSCKETFDLILIDIFQDAYMPLFLFEEYFVTHLKRILNVNGFIIFNTITLTQADMERNQAFEQLFESDLFSVRYMKESEKFNDVITIKRLQ